MRTNQEIVERYKRLRTQLVGSMISFDLLELLPFEDAKPFFNEKAGGEEEWEKEGRRPNTREYILGQMRDYMPFAWEKMVDERGISANRSIGHFQNWVWLLEDEETYAFLKDPENYPEYGRPMLERLCEVYDLPKEKPAEATG